MGMNKVLKAGLLATLIGAAIQPAFAENEELHLALQPGISYLPLVLLQHNNLIEQEVKAAGLGDVKVTWNKFAGGNVMNEALLSGSLDIGVGGLPPAITLWAKTKGQVKLISAVSGTPLLLVTNNPAVKSIDDLTDKDRIALPAAKVSTQAVLLQMAAAQKYGIDKANKFDPITVTLSHPDAVAALSSNNGGVNSHFSGPPFQYQELKQTGVHSILDSYDVLGIESTHSVLYTTQKFRDDNPKLYGAFLKALDKTIDKINQDKHAAAAEYVKYSKDAGNADDVYKIITEKHVKFTTTPTGSVKFADFMYQVGSVKQKVNKWQDLYFPEIHSKSGS